jgi:hypothetical protein
VEDILKVVNEEKEKIKEEDYNFVEYIKHKIGIRRKKRIEK